MLKFYLKNLFVLSLLSLSLLLTSCNPENSLARNLVGTWEITSYILDGSEEIGNTFQSIEIEFKSYNGDKGKFTFTSVDLEGNELIEAGNYSLDDEGTLVELTLEDERVLVYEVWAKRDEMEMIQEFGAAKREYRGTRK
ncbi:MAG: lipocalin family protein [Bacteroidia bacterium]|nr:lipocalin family protein [Bacteroidia bacterium]